MSWLVAIVIVVVVLWLSARSGRKVSRSNRTADWGELLDRDDVLVLDSETTGISESAEIIELALLDTTGAVRLDTLVMPKGHIPAAASNVHGITRQDLRKADAPAWPDVHHAVCKLLQATKVVLIYNAEYDTRLLRQTAERHGLTMPAFASRCLMLDYADYRRVPTRKNGWRWFKLVDAARQHDIAVQDSHRAAGDARLALALMRAVAAGRQAT